MSRRAWGAALLAALLAVPVAAEEPSAADGTIELAQVKRREGVIRRGTPPADAQKKEEAATEAPHPATDHHAHEPEMSDGARRVRIDPELFKSDPEYADHAYDAGAQREIYGGKQGLKAPRPLLELGYPMYHEGSLGGTGAWMGRLNPTRSQFLVYGDWRMASALNDDDDATGAGDGESAVGISATRLNLDFDWKITATERLHVLMRPLDRKGKFSRSIWQGAAPPDGTEDEAELNGNLVTAFFEGDAGAIWQGITGRYNRLDLPFAVGLVPMLFQNGIWLDDAFSGLAVTLPARNSPRLDITNMDFTFFAGFDKVSLPVFGDDETHGKLIGVTTFIETMEGYWEAGYGYLHDNADLPADRSFHSATVAFTRRYGGWLSNSVRIVGSFGQDDQMVATTKANGALLLIENSLVTRLPYTLVPYLNLFWGVDSPQSLARDPGAGGILKNTGLNFETDGLTGFPKLDDTAARAFGGALGLQYLFNLNQQIVLEVATAQRTESAPGDTADYGVGLRYQVPFWKRYILRVDAITGRVNDGAPAATPFPGNERDISGVRLELRAKF